jgi:hypothetical protein
MSSIDSKGSVSGRGTVLFFTDKIKFTIRELGHGMVSATSSHSPPLRFSSLTVSEVNGQSSDRSESIDQEDSRTQFQRWTKYSHVSYVVLRAECLR